VAGHGLVMRAFASQPFCLNPASFDSLWNLNPRDHLGSICFAPCTTISLEPLLKSASWYYRRNPLDRTNFSNLGAWWSMFGTPAAVHESRFTYEFALADDAGWEKAASKAIAGGRIFRTQLHAACTAYRLWKECVGRGYYRASEVLAVAQYVAPLRRQVMAPEGALFLVPVDDAFTQEADQALSALLAPGRERDLMRLVRDHVLIPGPGNTWRTASGRPIHDLERHIGIAGSPFKVEGFLVYPIDHVLGLGLPSSVSRATAAREASVLAETARAPRPLAGVATRNGLRRLLLWLETVPGGARVARKARNLPTVYSREGWEGIARRVAARAYAHPRLARFARLAERPARLALKAQRAVRYIRRHGVAAGWQRYRMLQSLWLVRTRERLLPKRAPRRADLDLLRQAQQVRALQAVCDILGHYETSVRLPGRRSAPLEWAREKLRSLGSEGEVHHLLERHLRELVRHRRRWSEAWLELGYLQLDLGRAKDALRSFNAAAAGSRLSSTDPAQRDTRLEAHAARARLLKAAGRADKADQAFVMALAYGVGDYAVNLDYGYHLRAAGEPRKATRHFAYGMEYDPVQWPLPGMPRDARQMDLQLVAARTTTHA
jgi:tetratricopeptide (TPR) repeat protein